LGSAIAFFYKNIIFNRASQQRVLYIRKKEGRILPLSWNNREIDREMRWELSYQRKGKRAPNVPWCNSEKCCWIERKKQRASCSVFSWQNKGRGRAISLNWTSQMNKRNEGLWDFYCRAFSPWNYRETERREKLQKMKKDRERVSWEEDVWIERRGAFLI
jgi:hypothetical protein